MILVKRPPRGGHGLVALPGLGHHHHHDVGQFAPGERQQFHHVVKHRRVAAVGVDDRQDLLDVVAKPIALEE
jgi:hypothetical protein